MRLRVRGAPELLRASLAALRAFDRGTPWMRVPSIADIFRTFGASTSSPVPQSALASSRRRARHRERGRARRRRTRPTGFSPLPLVAHSSPSHAHTGLRCLHRLHTRGVQKETARGRPRGDEHATGRARCGAAAWAGRRRRAVGRDEPAHGQSCGPEDTARGRPSGRVEQVGEEHGWGRRKKKMDRWAHNVRERKREWRVCKYGDVHCMWVRSSEIRREWRISNP